MKARERISRVWLEVAERETDPGADEMKSLGNAAVLDSMTMN
jgi:hypothetical protein